MTQIYDGSNLESLILFETTFKDNFSIYVNGISNKTIVSSDNVVYVKLIAGQRSSFGISFLLSWTQIDELNSELLHPEFEIPSQYFMEIKKK